MRQLALPLAPEPDYGAAFIEAPGNADALRWLAPGVHWPLGRLAVWGPEGCGKTHLLHLWAARNGAQLLRGAGLRFLPRGAPLAIDDADAAPEHDLLHTLNAAAEAGERVLLAARSPPARWAVALPDLASRLRATAAVEIRTADDALLRDLLRRLFAERHLAVSEELQDWLRLRLPRTQAAMREAAARIDRASLAARRPVSRPLVQEVLAGLAAEGWDGVDDESASASPDPPRFL
jgi:chromosomal replication initiation ATPase DnaA